MLFSDILIFRMMALPKKELKKALTNLDLIVSRLKTNDIGITINAARQDAISECDEDDEFKSYA
jgi:hypothetical protein